ncbi:phage protein NinX family protein [Trinickia diaoshuihuensis]|uniref:phage protein NinX family protein n=1 Tax=Trinickia diaoshuihuensis TaxID=2292265 RepID=UPI000E24D296|nr:phage protein NinX family protein [Trinickia diaoshuihuensis]
MNTGELQGSDLDYWCARALVDDDEEIVFTQVEPSVVVTFTHGALRKLAQPFAPASEWGDALEMLERARDLQWRRDERGAHCRAQFEGADPCEAQGEHPRIALLRAFVRARFGETVGDRPAAPHAVRGGKVRPYDAGGVPPTYGDNVGAGDEIGNIRSVPRP